MSARHFQRQDCNKKKSGTGTGVYENDVCVCVIVGTSFRRDVCDVLCDSVSGGGERGLFCCPWKSHNEFLKSDWAQFSTGDSAVSFWQIFAGLISNFEWNERFA